MRELYDGTCEFVPFILSDERWEKLKADCMDALCLAVSGRLGKVNGFAAIPENPVRDARGLAMEIVCGKRG